MARSGPKINPGLISSFILRFFLINKAARKNVPRNVRIPTRDIEVISDVRIINGIVPQEIANKIIKYTQPDTTIRYISDRLGHDFRYAVNFSKIERLGYSPKRSIKNSKEWNEIIEFYKKHWKTQT